MFIRKYLGRLGTKHLFKLMSGQPISRVELLWMRLVQKLIKGWDITLTM